MRTTTKSIIAFLSGSKKTLLLTVIVAITAVAAAATASVLLSRAGNLTVPSHGNIKTIGVETYWDQNTENKTELINWNEMTVGASKDVTLYIQSVSNQKVVLNLEATDWNPPTITEYTSLSWDYNGTVLDPGETIKVTLTLTFSSSESFATYLVEENVLNYSFDIHIVTS